MKTKIHTQSKSHFVLYLMDFFVRNLCASDSWRLHKNIVHAFYHNTLYKFNIETSYIKTDTTRCYVKFNKIWNDIHSFFYPFSLIRSIFKLWLCYAESLSHYVRIFFFLSLFYWYGFVSLRWTMCELIVCFVEFRNSMPEISIQNCNRYAKSRLFYNMI